MAFGSSPEHRVLARVWPWLAIDDFHHIMYSTNALCQQLVLTIAFSWASLLNPYIQQAILSLHQGTKHESPPLSFTSAWQDANQGHYSSLWPICSALSHYSSLSSKNTGKEGDCKSNSISVTIGSGQGRYFNDLNNYLQRFHLSLNAGYER